MERIKAIDCLKKKYVIPCFQREYSWGEEEIGELIENLKNIKENDNYCLGIVTIQNKKQISLLIDGQQRITTLYLIAIYCELIKKPDDIMLSFEYDDLFLYGNDLIKLIEQKEDISYNIKNGYKIISNNIKEEKKKISEILSKVYYYEIDIDDNIDLNHYFEVMNSRGVQLSRSDIVKSYLMNILTNEEDKYRLNTLWYTYEKMDINNVINDTFEKIPNKNKSEYKTINQILANNRNSDNKSNSINNNIESDNSILNFDFFLLYIIRLYKNINNEEYEISGEFNLNDLIEEYKAFFYGKNSQDVIDFLNFMINMKSIYDKYIVKYDNENENWILGVEEKNILLIQSCLRVSFINRRLMHWIYITLKYFYINGDKREYSVLIKGYNDLMRKFIRKNYVEDFLDRAKELEYKTGLDTPNIILNYLDLLIKENYNDIIKKIPEAKNLKLKEFKFKFRNSIEHFKPRHDSDGNLNPEWVDDFGNLALLAYGTNIRMQNAEPDEKVKHFEKDLSGYSLKLQIMSKITLKNNGDWNEKLITDVRKIMIEILKNDIKKI